MKRILSAGLFFIIFFINASIYGLSTQVTYTTTDLGSGRWEYVYDVMNTSLSTPIEEFTIWFDYDLYDNLTIETLDPPASGWDEIVWQPDPPWSINGGYDALTLGSGIAQGNSVSGFAVSFDWLSTGNPGSQFYEIVDPITFKTLDSGQTSTIPAPSALILVMIGLGALRFKNYNLNI